MSFQAAIWHLAAEFQSSTKRTNAQKLFSVGADNFNGDYYALGRLRKSYSLSQPGLLIRGWTEAEGARTWALYIPMHL